MRTERMCENAKKVRGWLICLLLLDLYKVILAPTNVHLLSRIELQLRFRPRSDTDKLLLSIF